MWPQSAVTLSYCTHKKEYKKQFEIVSDTNQCVQFSWLIKDIIHSKPVIILIWGKLYNSFNTTDIIAGTHDDEVRCFGLLQSIFRILKEVQTTLLNHPTTTQHVVVGTTHTTMTVYVPLV